jgi:hypothetical protein
LHGAGAGFDRIGTTARFSGAFCTASDVAFAVCVVRLSFDASWR